MISLKIKAHNLKFNIYKNIYSKLFYEVYININSNVISLNFSQMLLSKFSSNVNIKYYMNFS